jgi:prophage regulatory protein
MKLLGYDDLRARGIKWSRVQIWRAVKAGKFPPPVKLGCTTNSTSAWVETEIDAWIARLMAARPQICEGASEAATEDGNHVVEN